MRLIDADTLKQEIMNEVESIGPEDRTAFILASMLHTIDCAPTMDEWRDARKILPAEPGYYLAVVNGEVEKAYYAGTDEKRPWAACVEGEVRWMPYYEVTHWKLLPELPEEGTANETN